MSRNFLAVLAVMVAVLALLPAVVSLFGLVQATLLISMAVLALSQGFIWGYGGIMSFGQSAFFGLGGYVYAVAAINIGESTIPFLLSIAIPAAFAALLGYFMFYGKISDAYVGVITLTVTVILFNVANSTAGDVWRIGQAALGGFNGIPSVPPINMPGNPDAAFGPGALYDFSAAMLVLVYVLLRGTLATRFGKVVVAIRENETRAMLLGYDPRLYKMLTFTIGGAVAGLAGTLFTNWGGFISPTAFGLQQAALAIIFVLVGGMGTLVGPILGAVAIEYLISLIGTQQTFNANLILGAVLLAFVLLVPQGLLPSAIGLSKRIGGKRGSNGAGAAAEAQT